MRELLKKLGLNLLLVLIMDFTLFGIEKVFEIDIPDYVFFILACILGWFTKDIYNRLFPVHDFWNNTDEYNSGYEIGFEDGYKEAEQDIELRKN